MSVTAGDEPNTAPAAPRLRPDVEVLRVGTGSFLIRDPRTGHSFALGPTERALVALVPKSITPGEVAAALTRRGMAVTPETVLEFVEQLRRFGLLDEPGGARSPPALEPRPEPDPDLPDADPARSLNTLFDLGAAAFRWAFHPASVVMITVLAVTGTATIVNGWDRYLGQLDRLVDELPIVLLAALSLAKTFFLVNLPREAAIGVACRKFGGRVNGFRVHWILGLAPFVHCEIGESALRLRGRARWTTLTAGLWCQTAIGGIAAIGWGMTNPRSDLSTVWLLILPAVLAHMALHAMIFLRFDCYRLLCAWLGDWRLRERALAETGAWLARRVSPEPLTPRERFWLRAYGLGYHVFVWLGSAVLVVGGSWWLESLMGPNGLLLGLAIGVWGFRGEIVAWLGASASWRWFRARVGAGPARATLAAALVVTAAVGLAWRRPLDGAGRAQVVPAEQAGLRARVDGVVARVDAGPGARVVAGDRVVTLASAELVRALGENRAAVEREGARLARLRAGNRAEDLAIAASNVSRARSQLALTTTEVAREVRLGGARASTARALDDARHQRDRAAAAAEVAKLTLARERGGARAEEIAAQEAEVERLQASLERLETLAGLLVLRAPLGGTVASAIVTPQPGQSVRAGDLIAVVESDAAPRVEVAASEEAAVRVEPGMEAEVRLDALDGRALRGRVVAVAAAAEPEGRIFAPRYRTARAVERSSRAATLNDPARVRVTVALADTTRERLAAGLSGDARIHTAPDRLGNALARAVLGYVRTELWAWLP
ncbi:MAG: HlyD family efflux transporter periplasmic adaptor subunit [Deltaproteobacteria bacterium]|nr:HlyD family efflux transporter periplasmic adaptor subunit [Deltaproteobacteria bacterium]